MRLKESGRWLYMKVSIAQNFSDDNQRMYVKAIENYGKKVDRKRKRFGGEDRWHLCSDGSEETRAPKRIGLQQGTERHEQHGYGRGPAMRSSIQHVRMQTGRSTDYGSRVMGRNIEIHESFSYIQETFNLDGFGI